MQIYENLRKSMKIYKNLRKSMRIYENLWKSMTIHENLWKSMKIQWYMCSEKGRWVIFYILNTWTPYISVLHREINCLNRENGNCCFQGNIDFDLQITYQSHSFDENPKWSHGHYGHFAPAGLTGNKDRSEVFDKSVEVHCSKSLALISGTEIKKIMNL